MRTKDIIKGLQILMPYYDKPDGYNIGANHDVIYAYATNNPISKKDLAKMIELGWHQEHDGRDYDNAFCPSDYIADESWHCYV